MKRVLFLLLPLLLACPAHAVSGNAFIYSKTILRIVPGAQAQQADAPLKENKEADKKNTAAPEVFMPQLKRSPKEFTVEVRTPSFLSQKDFILHQPFTDRQGMLILVDPPAIAEVTATRMIASADVLFINEDGAIVKIAPRLKLSDLTESIGSGGPIRAFVYLKPGTTEANDIQVGDRIENTYFKTHPVVIQ